ncbi:MAG: UDP-glucose 4-epimerase GalE [Phycisphaerae bacterium]|nr:UDP-glucose 4-epimerase GalE [Phycisphaerae bacterium]
MNILATGGAGYVGSTVLRQLLKQGHNCWAYDNLSKGFTEAVPDGHLIEGDLADYDKLVSVMKEKKIDAIMHFAASIAVGESCQMPREYYRNNVVNSLTLLDSMQDAGVGKIVFSSTAAVFAPAKEGASLNEESPKDPDSPYAFSKYAIERMIQHFSKAYGIGFTILRYFNACGADPTGQYGEAHEPETHLIPLVLQVPLGQRESISVFGNDYPTEDGTCVRDYIHVQDLADAHIRAVENMEVGKGNFYNIGTGKGNSVMEVIRAAEEVVGQQIPYVISGRRDGDTAVLVASSDKLKSELGWVPKYTDIKDIIADAWRWHKDHPNGY